MKKLSQVIAQKRRERGFHQQKDFAEAIEVSPAYISRMEKGQSIPGEELILAIADMLYLDAGELLLMGHIERCTDDRIRQKYSVILATYRTSWRQPGLVNLTTDEAVA